MFTLYDWEDCVTAPRHPFERNKFGHREFVSWFEVTHFSHRFFCTNKDYNTLKNLYNIHILQKHQIKIKNKKITFRNHPNQIFRNKEKKMHALISAHLPNLKFVLLLQRWIRLPLTCVTHSQSWQWRQTHTKFVLRKDRSVRELSVTRRVNQFRPSVV